MSPERVGLVLLALAFVWQAWARVRFERWARAELARVGRAGACTQKAHERICGLVHALDLRVPKSRERRAGWGTMLDDAETRARGSAETFPALDLGALEASRRQ